VWIIKTHKRKRGKSFFFSVNIYERQRRKNRCNTIFKSPVTYLVEGAIKEFRGFEATLFCRSREFEENLQANQFTSTYFPVLTYISKLYVYKPNTDKIALKPRNSIIAPSIILSLVPSTFVICMYRKVKQSQQICRVVVLQNQNKISTRWLDRHDEILNWNWYSEECFLFDLGHLPPSILNSCLDLQVMRLN
jgi:hypothetical protein